MWIWWQLKSYVGLNSVRVVHIIKNLRTSCLKYLYSLHWPSLAKEWGLSFTHQGRRAGRGMYWADILYRSQMRSLILPTVMQSSDVVPSVGNSIKLNGPFYKNCFHLILQRQFPQKCYMPHKLFCCPSVHPRIATQKAKLRMTWSCWAASHCYGDIHEGVYVKFRSWKWTRLRDTA